MFLEKRDAVAQRRHPKLTRGSSLPLVATGLLGLIAPILSPLNTTISYASDANVITTTGGATHDDAGYRYHAFTHSGDLGTSTDGVFEVVGGSITADVLVVAGGGGGGRNRAGGGGAGGLLLETATIITAGTHTATVGGGGKGGSKPVPTWLDAEASPGCQGEDSSFLTLTAVGGGGGGANASSAAWVDCEGAPLPSDYGPNGGAGGSGGGGAYVGGQGGLGTAGQGNSGGSVGNSPAGGGGGAGAGGSAGAGGAGRTGTEITAMGLATGLGQPSGSSVYFAGGGGGFSSGTGGLGGGGRSGTAGQSHTGGGGGACQSTSCNGGSPGGSGVVIVRYAVPHFTAMTSPHVFTDPLEIGISQGDAIPAIALTDAVQVTLLSGNLPDGVTLDRAVTGNEVTFQGTVHTPGSFDFMIRAFKSDPSQAATVYTDRRVVLNVTANQTLNFPSIGNQDLRQGSVQATADSLVAGTATPTGLSASWSSNDAAICTVDASGEVTFVARGSCQITASQAGGSGNGFSVNPATPVSRSFDIYDTALSSLTVSTGTLVPNFDQAETRFGVSLANSVVSIGVNASTRYAGAAVSLNGTPLTSGQESAPQSLVVGQNTLNIVVTDGDQQSTVIITVTRAGATTQSPSRPRPQPAPEPEVTTPVPGALVIPRPAPPTPPATITQNPTVSPGPVIVGGQPPRPANQPTATIGGTATPVTKAPLGDDGVRVTTGSLDFGIRAPAIGSGAIQRGQGSLPELVVPAGTQTQISGTGVAPGSTVQAFLTLDGTNAVELGRIQADSTGSFSGSAVLATPPGRDPLPIGRQVLQILGVDENGNQTVVNMAITVAQPPPQPELNRENQEIPGLQPGQTLATVAGLPTTVDVTPLPEENQTRIDGEGWSMAIDLSAGAGGIEASQDGTVQLTLVRDQEASVSGSGFMPFTRADVWLFSTPTLLGTVDIDENGEFNGVVNVDGTVVAAGEHTLQLQGVGEDGYVRAANLGVVVADDPSSAPTPTSTESLSALLWSIGGGAVLTIALVATWWIRRRTKIDLNPNG